MGAWREAVSGMNHSRKLYDYVSRTAAHCRRAPAWTPRGHVWRGARLSLQRVGCLVERSHDTSQPLLRLRCDCPQLRIVSYHAEHLGRIDNGDG